MKQNLNNQIINNQGTVVEGFTLLFYHCAAEPHLVTHHADRQHPVNDGKRQNCGVTNKPFVFPKFIPANQVTLWIGNQKVKYCLSKKKEK